MSPISNDLYFRIYHNIFNIVKGIVVFKDFPLFVIKNFPDIKGLSMHSICIYRIFMNFNSITTFFFLRSRFFCLSACNCILISPLTFTFVL